MSELMVIFLIMALGYMVGYINFFGIKLGASAILIISLVFGHFGYDIPDIIGTIGLVFFLAPIGLMSGDTFVSNIKINGIKFLLIAVLTCIVGGIMIGTTALIFDIPIELSTGLGTGALTSTAMLGSVMGLTDSPLPSVGYGIGYPFGVVGVVLFVQLLPRILKVDIDAENEKITIPESKTAHFKKDKGSLVIGVGGRAPGAVLLLHIHTHTTIRVNNNRRISTNLKGMSPVQYRTHSSVI